MNANIGIKSILTMYSKYKNYSSQTLIQPSSLYMSKERLKKDC